MEARLNEIVQLIREHLTQHRCDDGIEQAAFIGKAAVNIPSATPARKAISLVLAAAYPFSAKTSMAAMMMSFCLAVKLVKSCV